MNKYLLDENLSRKLTDKIDQTVSVVTHVALEGLLNSFDTNIWQFAKQNSFIIITKDNDFFDMSHLYGCPPKVIRINCGNRTTDYIAKLLSDNWQHINAFADSFNCYMEII